MRRILQRGILVVGAVALLACSVAPAEAQRRAIRRPSGRSVVVVGGYYRPAFYNPFFWGGYSGFWSGYAGWGWHPFYYGGYYPPQWGYYGRRDQAAVRIQVKPREAQVYVDGYYAGIVDDFDGALQRLRARSGDHEIVLYLKGYRTERQTLRLEPGEEYTIRLEMEPLAPGEANEAPPVPAPRGAQEARDPRDPQGPPPVQAPRPGSGGLEPPPAPPRAGEWPGRSRPTAEGFGTLSIRV